MYVYCVLLCCDVGVSVGVVVDTYYSYDIYGAVVCALIVVGVGCVCVFFVNNYGVAVAVNDAAVWCICCFFDC